MVDSDLIGTTGGAKDKSSSGSSSSSGPSLSLEKPPRAVAEFIVYVMRQENQPITEFPAFDEDAKEVAPLREADLGDELNDIVSRIPESVEYQSFESFFSANFDEAEVDYVGTPVLLNEREKGEWSDLPDEVKEQYEDGDLYKYGDPDNDMKKYVPAPDWVEVVREGRIEDSLIYEAATQLNGHYFKMLWDAFYNGEPIKWSVGIGKNHNHQTEDGEPDEKAKRKNVSFAAGGGASAFDSAVTAMGNVGTLDEDVVDDFEDGAIDMAGIVANHLGNEE